MDTINTLKEGTLHVLDNIQSELIKHGAHSIVNILIDMYQKYGIAKHG